MSDARPATTDDCLEVSGLACAAGLRTLFSEIAFRLEPGQWIRLSGPNGCGKSTLLRALAGLVRPVGGSIRWSGVETTTDREAWHAAIVYQGHLPACKDGLTARENLYWQLVLDGEDTTAARVGELLAKTGLARQARLAYQRLSAGQRRRLGLARLVASRRPLWLLDEPTTALDAAGETLFGAILDDHLARGGLAICATHLALPVTSAPLRVELGAGAGP